jgi:FkbM family methyltransferase
LDPLPPWRLDEANPQYGKLFAGIMDQLRQAPAVDRNDLAQFLAFAAPLAARSKSQIFQELWALWMSGGKRDGYFVEFGAAKGDILSNTWFLETGMGWNGIVAEPHPRLAERVRRVRNCHVSDLCLYSRSGETMTFRMTPKQELSRLEAVDPQDKHESTLRATYETAEVRTISLNDLLTRYDAPRDIDYLSVDTEGSELEILQAFDFDRWNVRCATVEHNHTPAEAALDALFFAKGYRRMWPQISRFDAWYVRD